MDNLNHLKSITLQMNLFKYCRRRLPFQVYLKQWKHLIHSGLQVLQFKKMM